MKFIFHPEAKAEFLAAIDYYEECEPGLGADFAIEVRATIENILSFPNAWPILAGDLRRVQTRRFPYGIIYSYDEGVLYILAVMHLHREPNYWKKRDRQV
jgi:plasmid stabilization system protein ParE